MAHKTKVTGDWFKYEGAVHLAGKIATYWEKRGKRVSVWVEKIDTVEAGMPDECVLYAVRSNMLNGRPR